jgi:hypothetical protein
VPAIGLELKISRPDIVSRKRAEGVARDADISRMQLSRFENGPILPISEVEARLRAGWTGGRPCVSIWRAC